MKENKRILDDILLSIEKVKTFNEIVEDTTVRKIDGKGVEGANILYAMTEVISKELDEIIKNIDKIYRI